MLNKAENSNGKRSAAMMYETFELKVKDSTSVPKAQV